MALLSTLPNTLKTPAYTRGIRLAIVNLAGIPSIVYGLFGLGVFVLFLEFGTSILAGSLTLGLMTLPVVISTSEEAILAVPSEFRLVSLEPGGHKMADDPQPGSAACAARHHYRHYSWAGARRRGNGAHPLYGGRLLSAAAAKVHLGSDNGLALSPLCHFHPGARHASRHSIRYSTRFAVLRSFTHVDRISIPHGHAPSTGVVGLWK